MSSITTKFAFLFLLPVFVTPAVAQGIFLTGVGAVNRSMGGAATAAPIDAMGALHWNPASISGLQSSEVAFSAEMMLLDHSLGSTIQGVGSGSDNAESGVAPLPAIGWVHHMDDSNWTVGLGLYSFAGFLQNLPMSTPATTNNPILFAQPQGGFGPLYSEAQFFQIAPTISCAVSDRLSVGLAPTITMGKLALDPNGFTAPLTNGAFPPGRASRYHWGGGAQLGVYYVRDENWRFGASVKSPQWFEEFRFTSLSGDPAMPTPAVTKAKLDLPMIVSLGASYSGMEDTLVAVDLRYWDYQNTDGFGNAGFTGGIANDLGWGNVFSVALGVQRRMSECLYVRAGYTYNTNPISSANQSINIASALIQQHVIGVGASYSFAENVDLTLSYIQILKASQTGPIPGGTVTNEVTTYSLGLAVTVRYGCR